MGNLVAPKEGNLEESNWGVILKKKIEQQKKKWLLSFDKIIIKLI